MKLKANYSGFRTPSPNEAPLWGNLVPALSQECAFEVIIPRRVYFRRSIQSEHTVNRKQQRATHFQLVLDFTARTVLQARVVLSHPSWDLDQAAPLVYFCCFVWWKNVPVCCYKPALADFYRKVFCLTSQVKPPSFPRVSEILTPLPPPPLSNKGIRYLIFVSGLPFGILEVMIVPVATRNLGLSLLPKDWKVRLCWSWTRSNFSYRLNLGWLKLFHFTPNMNKRTQI